MKKLTLLSFFIALSLVLSSCSLHLGLSSLLGKGSNASGTLGAKTIKATHTPPSNVSAISINNGKFRPKNVSVKTGTTLTWTNNDDTPQTVTSDAPGVFDSGPIAPGATFQYTFSKDGVFPYHSTGTSGSYGTITVAP
jgi:plastocyanin